jgi:hypothetical protein
MVHAQGPGQMVAVTREAGLMSTGWFSKRRIAPFIGIIFGRGTGERVNRTRIWPKLSSTSTFEKVNFRQITAVRYEHEG